MPGETEKTPSSEDGIHRLLGMLVEEVSVVDAAANQRKFLVVKKDTMAQTRKDDTAAAPAMPGGSPSTTPEKLPAMQAQVKDALLSALTSAAEKLMSIATAVKEAETTDGEATPPVAESVTASLGELASMLAGLQSQYGGKATKEEAQPEPGTTVEPAKSDLSGVTENGAAGDQGAQKRDAMAKALDGLRKSNGKDVTIKSADVMAILKGIETMSPVAKVGRKMAKERLERFRKAMDLLASIMKELMNDAGRTNKSAGPATPGVTSSPSATGHVVLKAGDAAALVASVDALMNSIKTKDEQIAGLQRAAKKLGATVQESQSLPAEGRAPTAPVAWPMDMNDARKPKGKPFSFSPNR